MKRRILCVLLVSLFTMLTVSCSGDGNGDSVLYGSAPTISFQDLLSSSSEDGSIDSSDADESVDVTSDVSSGAVTNETPGQETSVES